MNTYRQFVKQTDKQKGELDNSFANLQILIFAVYEL